MIEMHLSDAAKILNISVPDADASFRGCSIDSRSLEAEQLFVALSGEKFDGHDFTRQAKEAGAAALMVEQEGEYELPHLLVEDTRLALGQLASGWRKQFNIPLVAITGSNGKTTVKEMLLSIVQQQYRVLGTQGNFNNDIGLPLTLFRLNDQHQVIITEMGANHAGEIDYLSRLAGPNVALITQCAPAHLEGFGSIEGVAHAKAEIFHGLVSDGTAIINGDDDYAEFWLEKTQGFNQMTFGLEKSTDVFATHIELIESYYSFHLNIHQESIPIQLQVAGKHNVMNAMAAACCAYALGIDLKTIQQGLETFSGVNGRMQFKQAACGARLIDDTYNANLKSFTAAINALASFKGDTWLIVGDMGELGDASVEHHQQVGIRAQQAGIKHLLSVGEYAVEASEQFKPGGQHFQDKASLINYLLQQAHDDAIILVKGSRSMQMEDIIHALIAGGNA